MKQNSHLKRSILAAAASLGLVASAFAQNANVAVPTPAPAETGAGLLGFRYTEVGYNFIDLKGSDNANGFGVTYNQPLNTGFDFIANYNWAKADFTGFDAKVQDLWLGLNSFSNQSWGKPFVLAAVGWEWQKVAGFRDDSFQFKVGTGAEFTVAPAFTLTPYLNYARATSFNASEIELGVKAAYRLNESWNLTARVQHNFVRHDDDNTEYGLGVAYRF
jgi:opacity protein-like surface antigen